jgi:hypothetical protein
MGGGGALFFFLFHPIILTPYFMKRVENCIYEAFSPKISFPHCTIKKLTALKRIQVELWDFSMPSLPS